MTARRILALASAVSFASVALADQVKVFKYADEAPALAAPAPALGRPAPRRIPAGIFGLYDPKTQQFTPMPQKSPTPEAATTTTSGTIKVHIRVYHSLDIDEDDTVFCNPTLQFGDVHFEGGLDFFEDLHEESPPSINFAAGSASRFIPHEVDKVFRYTDANPDAGYRVLLECYVPNASDGSYHKQDYVTESAPPKSGVSDVTVNMYL